MLIEFLYNQNLYEDTKNHVCSPYIKEDIGDFMLWRPSWPPFCVHVTDMSEINLSMLNRFLDLKNLFVATKIMCLWFIARLRNLHADHMLTKCPNHCISRRRDLLASKTTCS